MHEQDHRPGRQGAPPLLHAVVAPIGSDGGPGDGARRLLVLQRHAVGEAPQIDQILGRKVPAVGEADLDEERIAAIDGRRTGRRRVEVGLDRLFQPFQDQLLADRHDAVGRRVHDLDLRDRPEQRLDLGCR